MAAKGAFGRLASLPAEDLALKYAERTMRIAAVTARLAAIQVELA